MHTYPHWLLPGCHNAPRQQPMRVRMHTASTALLDPTHDSPPGDGRAAVVSEGARIRNAPRDGHGGAPQKPSWRIKNRIETVASVTAACIVSVILTIGLAMTGLM